MADRKRELVLLKLVVNFGFKEGWITEAEKLHITTKATLDFKKLAFFDILINTRCDANAGRLLCALRCIDEVKLEPTPKSNTIAEYNCLSIIMSKLYTNGLATKEDKLVYENRLLDKMAKENAVEKEKLELSKTETGVTVQGGFDKPKSEYGNLIENSTNPMLIALVIKCVLQYLEFEEVKNARYISEVWSSVGLNELKTRAKIKFSQKTLSGFTDRTPLNFLSMFPSEPLETVPFSNYGFYDQESPTSWTIDELNYFFRRKKENIKKLEFNDIDLVGKNWKKYNKFDISPWLTNSAMTKPNTKYKTRLDISVHRDIKDPIDNNGGSTLLFVQLSALLNIKEVKLVECDVHLHEGILISPTKIEIVDVYFHKKGNKLNQICINDIADFSKAKKITLMGIEYPETKATKMILDMGRNPGIKLKSLILWNVTLKNLENCTWNVDQLQLDYVSFTERSGIEVKELTISSSQVDIPVLPQSIEKLIVYEDRQSNFLCSQPIILHNLKIMKLDFGGSSEILWFLNFLKFKSPQIFKCPGLVELHLENTAEPIKKIKSNLIPQTLKILTMRGIRIEDDGSNILNLDKLVLDQYLISKLGKFCGNLIQTTNLVLSFPTDGICNIEDFLYFLNNQNTCHGADRRIYAGNFNWQNYPENEFEESRLKGYVDKKAEYYVFENKIGKAISYKEFDRVKGYFE